jgi:NitT/TauT family transport system substrate-binding protein
MISKIRLFLILVVLTTIVAFPGYGGESASKTPRPAPVIRFGTLPVIQALPLFIAAEKGFFKEEGLNVELIGFNSALEKDVALTSGQIAGYFGDLQTCIVLSGNGVPIKIVAEIYNANKGRRTFALLVSPKSAGQALPDVLKGGVAVSSNTILDYLTTKLLASRGVPLAQATLVELKNIPIRMQMLLGGQVSAGVLPEPLATLAESKGARAIMDDAGTGLSSTVLAFNEKFLTQSPESTTAFLRAVSRASEYINGNADEVRPIMNRECRMPDQLQKSFPIPEFPKLALPTVGRVNDVLQWLHEKGAVKRDLTYRQMVADGYLR